MNATNNENAAVADGRLHFSDEGPPQAPARVVSPPSNDSVGNKDDAEIKSDQGLSTLAARCFEVDRTKNPDNEENPSKISAEALDQLLLGLQNPPLARSSRPIHSLSQLAELVPSSVPLQGFRPDSSLFKTATAAASRLGPLPESHRFVHGQDRFPTDLTSRKRPASPPNPETNDNAIAEPYKKIPKKTFIPGMLPTLPSTSDGEQPQSPSRTEGVPLPSNFIADHLALPSPGLGPIGASSIEESATESANPNDGS